MGESVNDFQKIKISGLWDSLKRYDGYIATVNFKSGLITTFNTALIAGVILKSDEIYKSSNCYSLAIFIILICINLLSIANIILVSISIFPRFSKFNSTYNSLFYFGSVAEFTALAYVDSIKSCTIENYEKDLAMQVQELGSILEKKFKTLRTALRITAVNLFLLSALSIFMLLGAYNA